MRRHKRPEIQVASPVGKSVDVLVAIYASDRAHAASIVGTISNVAVAMMTYVGATGVFLATRGQPIPAELFLAPPVPVWGLLYFHLTLFTMMAARTRSILIVERELVAQTSLESQATLLGQRAEERLTNHHNRPLALRPVSVLTFVLDAGAIIGYTGYCLLTAVQSDGWEVQSAVSAAAYFAFAVMAVGALLHLSSILKVSAELSR